MKFTFLASTLLLISTGMPLSFAQTDNQNQSQSSKSNKVNDSFMLYICAHSSVNVSRNCSVKVVVASKNQETKGENNSSAFDSFTMIDPGGNKTRQACVALNIPSSPLDSTISVTPDQSCHDNLKLIFLDKSYFYEGDFIVYRADGTVKNQLKYVAEKYLWDHSKSNHYSNGTFTYKIHGDLKIISYHGDEAAR